MGVSISVFFLDHRSGIVGVVVRAGWCVSVCVLGVGTGRDGITDR